MPAYTTDVVRTEREFRALREEWDRLYAESERRNVYLSHAWTDACWTNACAGSGLYVVTARAGERLVGIAPLRLARWSMFRVLWFIGNGWSDYTGFLTAPDQPGVEAALLAELARRRREWDLAYLRQLADDYTRLYRIELPEALRGRSSEATIAPYLRLEGEWDALCAGGPPSLRRGKRAARKFVKEGGTVERFTGAEAAGHLDTAAAIEARSWKASKGTVYFQTERSRGLIRQAFETLPEGEIELWLASIGGEPIAFQINIVSPTHVGYYLSAFADEGRRWYPGFVLHYVAMEHSWRSGRREYDFLTGDEEYKTSWTDAERPLRYRALFPAGVRGYLAFGLLIAPRWRLRNFKPADAALDLWERWRSNPAGFLQAAFAGRSRT